MSATSLEAWKPIPEAPHYSVSTHGRVRKLGASREHFYPKRFVADGRLCVAVRTDNGARVRGVANLVATAFLANPERVRSVRCVNGDVQDCRVSNLAWGHDRRRRQDAVSGVPCESAQQHPAPPQKLSEMAQYQIGMLTLRVEQQSARIETLQGLLKHARDLLGYPQQRMDLIRAITAEVPAP